LCAVRRLSAEISTPGLAAGAGALREVLAMAIRAFQPAEVGAFAGPVARHKKRHVGRLGRLLLRVTRA